MKVIDPYATGMSTLAVALDRAGSDMWAKLTAQYAPLWAGPLEANLFGLCLAIIAAHFMSQGKANA